MLSRAVSSKEEFLLSLGRNGRVVRAFPAHDASKLPSAQYNFYVKEAYFGVTYSGFLQGPAIFTDTHILRHLTKEATKRSDPSEPQPSESGHNPE